MDKKFKAVVGGLFAVQMVVNAAGFYLYSDAEKKANSEEFWQAQEVKEKDMQDSLKLLEVKDNLEQLTYRFNEHLLWSHNESALRKFSGLDEVNIKLMTDQRERKLSKYPDINLHD